MGGLSAAVATWAVSVILAGTPVGTQLAQAPSVSAQMPEGGTRVVAGFRMEGAPEVDVVFGDSAAYRDRIDRFFALEASMKSSRKLFSKHIQSVLAALAYEKRGCPKALIAPYYFRAHKAGEEYRQTGIDFETEYTAIRTLHRYGESSGLTPDYRWRVNKVRRLYRAALTDFREMTVAISEQLDPELRHRGCSADALRTAGALLPVQPLGVIAANTPKPAPRRWRRQQDKTVIEASTVTFFIDNSSCDVGQKIIADGKELGVASPRRKAAFQTLAGSHAICLVPEGSAALCGEVGTVRTAYIHDGWSMTLHCQ